MESIIVVVTGPESSGKSQLCRELSESLNCPWVPEYAREYLEKHGPQYDADDFLKIYRKQRWLQAEAKGQKPSILILDTDSVNFMVWSKWVFDKEFPEVSMGLEQEAEHHYLICKPDLPWAEDPLRENPQNRRQIYHDHLGWIKSLNRPYGVVQGQKKERLENALNALKDLKSI